MVRRGLERQPVRHGGSYLVEEQTRFAQCSPFRSHSKSSRRLREVDLVLTLNSRPLLAPPPPSQKTSERAWFPFTECKINRPSTEERGPFPQPLTPELEVGAVGSSSFSSVWLGFLPLIFIFCNLCFLEARLCGSTGVREILGRSCQTSKGEELSVLRV